MLQMLQSQNYGLQQLTKLEGSMCTKCRNPSFGLTTKAKGLQRYGPKGSLGVTSHIPGSVRKCEGVNPHTPKAIPLWEMESQWTPKTSESDFRGQNSLPCGVLYVIGKLLERKCLKWARITHLDIWNTSYGQKKGRKSNYQFDSRLEKVGNRPDLLGWRQRATYRWKALDEISNFALNCTLIRGLLAKLCGPKSRES
jgi:hypothetical protein